MDNQNEQPLAMQSVLEDIQAGRKRTYIKKVTHAEEISRIKADDLTPSQRKAWERMEGGDVLPEIRSAHKITGQLIDIHQRMKPRWESYKAYQEWEDGKRSGAEPTYTDEETGKEKSGKFALSPSKVVNESLNEFVGMTLKIYESGKLSQVQKLGGLNPQTKEAISDLRQIAIHAEEEMEQEAIGLIFKSIDNNLDTYKDDITAITRQKLGIADNAALPQTAEAKSTMFETLIHDYPKQQQANNPEDYPGLVFPYIKNYPPLVDTELKLLTEPAPRIESTEIGRKGIALDKALEQSGISDQKREEIESSIPELFGMKDASEKNFSFVGAGFPLTGILLHIQTGGAQINLVDYNKQAVENAKKLIDITSDLGITERDKIDFLHADARDVTYIPPNEKKEAEYVGKHKFNLPTDNLDLASALPSDVTDSVLQNNAKAISSVRKRNVRGASFVLYEPYELDESTSFRQASEVAPPQKVISSDVPSEQIVGIMDAINVNSCDVYVNTNLLDQKLQSLAVTAPAVYSQYAHNMQKMFEKSIETQSETAFQSNSYWQDAYRHGAPSLFNPLKPPVGEWTTKTQGQQQNLFIQR